MRMPVSRTETEDDFRSISYTWIEHAKRLIMLKVVVLNDTLIILINSVGESYV